MADCSPDSINVEVVQEGLAKILIPRNVARTLDPKGHKKDEVQQSVFYNPIQQFNRDLSVLAVLAYGYNSLALKESKRGTKGRQARKRATKHHEPSSNSKALHDPDNRQEMAERNTKKLKTHDTANGGHHNTQRASRSLTGPDITLGEGSEVQVTKDKQVPKALSGLDQTGRPAFTILDALSATGLRALRYAKEIPFVTSVTANDLSPDAAQAISENVKYNAVENIVHVTTGNAMALMYSLADTRPEVRSASTKKFDVVDLDPYGTAVPFLDAAIHALNDGGMLCVTCTDAGVFASVGYPEKTFALYGGTPIKGFHSHEGGLRLILHAIATSAARYGMSIEPLLSLSIDYYARCFVRVRKSPAETKFMASKAMLVYSCDAGCGAWQVQRMARAQPVKAKDGSVNYKHGLSLAPTSSQTCEHCGFKTHMSGPMYGGPLHNAAFIQNILDRLPDIGETTYATKSRVEGMLSTALEETQLYQDVTKAANAVEDEKLGCSTGTFSSLDPAVVDHHPFSFSPSALAGTLHCRAPSEAAVKGALRSSGYRAVRTHTKPGLIRTDAPWTFLWEMMRQWIQQKAPIKEGAIREGTAGWNIMYKKDGDSEQLSPTSTDSAGGKQGSAKGFGEIDFNEALGKEKLTSKRLIRYQINPRANWGPMNKAKHISN